MQLVMLRLYDFAASRVTSFPHAFLASSNFNINVLQKNIFCRFISDQDKKGIIGIPIKILLLPVLPLGDRNM